MRFSDPSEMPRARRTPARTAPTERAAPKATADGSALPLFPNRRKRAADGNRTPLKKETKRICTEISLTIKKDANSNAAMSIFFMNPKYSSLPY